MEKLQVGFITTEELADWAGISLKYLQDRKNVWCNKHLSKYANYKLKRGGVEIIEIFQPYYQTNGKKEVKEKYYEYWGTPEFRVSSPSDCWNAMKGDMTNILKDSTGRAYVSQSKCEEYGVPYKKRKRGGSKGDCRYVFCKIKDGQYCPFTEREEEIRKKLNKKYFANREKEAYEMQALFSDFTKGNLTQEEYTEAVQELVSTDKGWIAFQNAFENAIGYLTDFAQLLEDNAIKTYAKEGEFEF